MSKVINSIVWTFGALALLGAMVYGLNHPPGKSNEAPATSYQERNLEVLKSVKTNDLVLCVVEKGSAMHTEIKFAFLVEQNKEKYMTGYYPSRYTLSHADGGESFSHLSAWRCEMRILRPSETRAASDMLARIILYGLNPR
jgi:hypothetical protein